MRLVGFILFLSALLFGSGVHAQYSLGFESDGASPTMQVAPPASGCSAGMIISLVSVQLQNKS